MTHGALVSIKWQQAQEGAEAELRQLVAWLESRYVVTSVSLLDFSILDNRASVDVCLAPKEPV